MLEDGICVDFPPMTPLEEDIAITHLIKCLMVSLDSDSFGHGIIPM